MMTERRATPTTFVIERQYDASPAHVFRGWADPVVKGRWFAAPDEQQAAPHALDFRVGGRETVSGGPPGGSIHAYDARYHEIVPDKRIVLTYDMFRDDILISVSLVTVEFAPATTGTRLVYTEQAVFLDGHDTASERERGTIGLLDALGVILRREPATA